MQKNVTVLFAERLLDIEVSQKEARALPRYLGERDRLWIEQLLDVYVSMERKCRGDLERRITFERPASTPPKRWLAMATLLTRVNRFEVAAPVAPITLRAEIFRRAAALRKQARLDVAAVIEEHAREHKVTAEELPRWLYGDLPQARVLCPREQPSCRELMEHYNMALAQSLLVRARYVTVTVGGNVKGLLRFARLQGLLCLAHSLGPKEEQAYRTASPQARLQLSGPLAVLRHTIKYGRALATWLPVVIRTPNWSLRAECVVNGQPLRFDASAHDPMGTTHAPLKRFDSKVEERFFRDLKRKAPLWEVKREVDAVQLGKRIVSADFCLVHREDGEAVYVEIVGYWTERYLRDKLAVLAMLPPQHRWLVCLDQSLEAEAARQIATRPNTFLFRRRIDVDDFLRHLKISR